MKISEILSKEFKVAPTLSEFVNYLLIDNTTKLNLDDYDYLCSIRSYNNFLKQPIELKMLVPVKDGKVLEEPREEKAWDEDGLCITREEMDEWYSDYQKAKEDVLFKKDKTETFSLSTLGISWEAIKDRKLSDLTGQPITDNYFKFLD